jgi:hypothetical protein
MPSSLRTALSFGPIVLAPGAYDGLTARVVAQHGFQAVYMTGAGTSVAHGCPDYGLRYPQRSRSATVTSGERPPGHRIAIFPALLLGPVVTACDLALTTLAQAALADGGEVASPASPAEAAGARGPAELFRTVGADDWYLRERYAAIESGGPAVTD